MFHINFLVDKEKLAKFVNNRQEVTDKEMERKQLEAKQEQHRHLTELCLRQELECTSDIYGRRKLMQN